MCCENFSLLTYVFFSRIFCSSSSCMLGGSVPSTCQLAHAQSGKFSMCMSGLAAEIVRADAKIGHASGPCDPRSAQALAAEHAWSPDSEGWTCEDLHESKEG